jgi:diphthine-ammonia ligase
MRLAALISGGKDSCHAARLYEEWGWEVAELLTLTPAEEDAWMFHTPNLRWVPLLARAWGRPHRSFPIPHPGEDAELSALLQALRWVRSQNLQGIVAGAIASSYQWSHLQSMAFRAGLTVFAPLWRVAGERVVREEIRAGWDIRISRVATESLGPELLGKRLDEELLESWRPAIQSGRLHPAGEGGEYETIVLDAPFFRARLEVHRAHVDVRGPYTATWVLDEVALRGKEQKPVAHIASEP